MSTTRGLKAAKLTEEETYFQERFLNCVCVCVFCFDGCFLFGFVCCFCWGVFFGGRGMGISVFSSFWFLCCCCFFGFWCCCCCCCFLFFCCCCFCLFVLFRDE
ncbi:hypothetical protein EGW08_019544 [Elysia chlorotica]|uniref:Uncharacterized protein n=1 Tax=Elysia chlorotica TaxID=188477 RepID=A0A433STU5_ELYCH|nr:hypothetical protein EGW08_019544 [Elysia chlorotica]